MNRAKLFWDIKADAWKAAASNPSSYYARRTMCVAELVSRNLAPGRCLDVGCGSGELSYDLAKRGYDVYGADISENMVSRAIDLLSAVCDDADMRFRVASSEGLPFDTEFELITAIGIFPYVEDYARYLDLLSHYLAPGGYIVASCTNRLSIYAYQQVLTHAVKFRPDRSWVTVSLNLLRTGVWSGGYVDRRSARQCYSAASFDRLFKRAGFERVDSIDLFNVSGFGLDANPLARGSTISLLARRLGWNHIGLYRKDM